MHSDLYFSGLIFTGVHFFHSKDGRGLAPVGDSPTHDSCQCSLRDRRSSYPFGLAVNKQKLTEHPVKFPPPVKTLPYLSRATHQAGLECRQLRSKIPTPPEGLTQSRNNTQAAAAFHLNQLVKPHYSGCLFYTGGCPRLCGVITRVILRPSTFSDKH